jgi:hypothetical protein
MKIEATKTTLKEILSLRNLFLQERNFQIRYNVSHERGSEIDNWIKFLQTLFKSTNIEHFGLLLHWYSKGLDNENIEIENRKAISYKSLTELDFKTLHEGTLLYVGK